MQATADGDHTVTATEVQRCSSPRKGPPAPVTKSPADVDRSLFAWINRSWNGISGQALAPVLGLANVRGGHSAVLLGSTAQSLCASGQNFFHFYLPGEPISPTATVRTDVPLNWVLSNWTTQAIRDAVKDASIENDTELCRLKSTLDIKSKVECGQK